MNTLIRGLYWGAILLLERPLLARGPTPSTSPQATDKAKHHQQAPVDPVSDIPQEGTLVDISPYLVDLGSDSALLTWRNRTPSPTRSDSTVCMTGPFANSPGRIPSNRAFDSTGWRVNQSTAGSSPRALPRPSLDRGTSLFSPPMDRAALPSLGTPTARSTWGIIRTRCSRPQSQAPGRSS
jgi:hypothetical protein